MKEHILFLTGKLAESRLRRVLETMQPAPFTWEVRNVGVKVAALMTVKMVCRRLGRLEGYSSVMLPGLCRGDLEEAARVLGVPVTRGPEDLKDLPEYFGRGRADPDLDEYDVEIFAEIVDAPDLETAAILERARQLSRDGANVIDIGCLPDTSFPHLAECVAVLKSEGFRVSVDSMQADELLAGARAGADYLLSLNESSLWIAGEVDAVPILVPEQHGDMESLYRCVDKLRALDRAFIADPVLDPVHFGFMSSLRRYAALRDRYPDIGVMMGIGNLTELTEADTTGINAVLFGLISELRITSVLTTEVSPHARTAVREADLARRIMYAARREESLPKGIDAGLLTTHERKPFPYSEDEIRSLASEITDPSYRIQVSSSGIHVYNRDGMVSGADPFDLFPRLAGLKDDAPHAFYMGVELARAQIAFLLGKRYVQDGRLDWGVAIRTPVEPEPDDKCRQSTPGPTLTAARRLRRKRRKDT